MSISFPVLLANTKKIRFSRKVHILKVFTTFKKSNLSALALVLALSVASTIAAHATGEATAPDATVYAGTISGAQTYLNSLISAYGVPAILVSLAVTGLGFVWKLAKRAFH